MCDCLKRIELELSEKVRDFDIYAENVTEVSFENTERKLGKQQLFSIAKIEYSYNGSNGGSKHKKVNVSYMFCPFCGESYEK